MTDIILQLCNITFATVQYHIRGHYSFLSLSFSRGPLTESNSLIFFHVRGHYSLIFFHVRGHYSFLSLSFSRGPLTESNYFPLYVGLHPTSTSLRLILQATPA